MTGWSHSFGESLVDGEVGREVRVERKKIGWGFPGKEGVSLGQRVLLASCENAAFKFIGLGWVFLTSPQVILIPLVHVPTLHVTRV